jgi:hypothetical protein
VVVGQVILDLGVLTGVGVGGLDLEDGGADGNVLVDVVGLIV